jgi:hypothetical protein
VEIGTMTETSFRDAPRDGAATDRLSVVYEVTAVDEAGNRSDPVAVTVDLPPAPSRAPVYLGIAALVLAGLAVAYRLYRRAVVDGRMAQGPAPEQREPELTATGGRPRRG